jgi:hypothetical protein
MLSNLFILFSVTALVQGRAVRRQDCEPASIVFDGRVAANATKADFDSTTGPFGPEFVKGQSESCDTNYM